MRHGGVRAGDEGQGSEGVDERVVRADAHVNAARRADRSANVRACGECHDDGDVRVPSVREGARDRVAPLNASKGRRP